MTFTAFPATMTAAGLLGLLLLILAGFCLRARFRLQQHSDRPPELREKLDRSMRVMSNFAEYVPLCLILIALLEQARAAPLLPFGLAGLLVFGRVAHAWGLTRHAGTSTGRLLGTLATLTCLGVASVASLWIALLAGR
ncbi:MAG: MAPEG family protein [Rhodothalassiaceae bacterium]